MTIFDMEFQVAVLTLLFAIGGLATLTLDFGFDLQTAPRTST